VDFSTVFLLDIEVEHAYNTGMGLLDEKENTIDFTRRIEA